MADGLNSEPFRKRPFNILVDRRGNIFVRYNGCPIVEKWDHRFEMVALPSTGDPERDEYNYDIAPRRMLTHSEADIYGGERVGFHEVPAGRFCRGKVDWGWKGYDLDQIEALVARMRADWGDIDVEMRIPDEKLHRYSADPAI